MDTEIISRPEIAVTRLSRDETRVESSNMWRVDQQLGDFSLSSLDIEIARLAPVLIRLDGIRIAEVSRFIVLNSLQLVLNRFPEKRTNSVDELLGSDRTKRCRATAFHRLNCSTSASADRDSRWKPKRSFPLAASSQRTRTYFGRFDLGQVGLSISFHSAGELR